MGYLECRIIPTQRGTDTQRAVTSENEIVGMPHFLNPYLKSRKCHTVMPYLCAGAERLPLAKLLLYLF